VLLLAISAVRVEKNGFSTPPPQNKHRILRINGIKKFGGIMKHTRGSLDSNFENRVVCDGPSHGSCSCIYVRLIKNFRLVFFYLG
jgi:hypothetical protein